MKKPGKPVTNRNNFPTSFVEKGKILQIKDLIEQNLKVDPDIERTYHRELKRFLLQTDKKIQNGCRVINKNTTKTREEVGNFSSLAKLLEV